MTEGNIEKHCKDPSAPCENEKSQSRCGIDPSVEKMGFWELSQSQKNHAVGPIPQITCVVIPEQHFLCSGIGSQNQKLLPLGSDAKFKPNFQPLQGAYGPVTHAFT